MPESVQKNNAITPDDIDIISEQALFSSVNLEQIRPLLEKCTTKCLQKDDVLIETGDANHFLYLIISGRFRVHLPNDKKYPVTSILAGESIGEISIIDRQPASAHVIADVESKVLMIDEHVFWLMLERNHTIAYNLMVVLAQRLRHGNSVMSRIKELLGEYEYNATVDALTGLYNRRWLDDMLSRIMHRCLINNQPLSALMIDIDYFKQYNDQHGHIAGDTALRIVSRSILHNLRPEDLITRYGGEEFFALLPGLELDAAVSISERLRETVSSAEIILRDKQTLPSLTISIGVTRMRNEDKPTDLIHAADKALYRAKHAGRNRVSQ